MSRSKQLKWSGWAFILAAFAFITILIPSDAVAIPGSVISTLLLAAGLSGLRAAYGKQVGGFGRSIPLIALVGIGLFLCLPLAVVAAMGADELIGAGLWILLFGGPAVVLIGLTLFGLAALRYRPMPRHNWLPAVAGIWYPLAYFLLAGYLFTHQGGFPQQYYAACQGLYLIQFAALCALGSILVVDAPQEDARGSVAPSQ